MILIYLLLSLSTHFTHAIEAVDGSGEPNGIEALDQANQEDAQNCSDVPVGGKRIVNMHNPMASTAPKMMMANDRIKYKIFHPDAQTYRLVFPVMYFRACDYTGHYRGKSRGGGHSCGHFDPAFDMIMRHRTQQCLDVMNKKMPSLNGAHIEYAIDPSYEAMIKNPDFGAKTGSPVQIAARAKGIRDDMMDYGADTACETLMHEMSHLTGLPDLYAETNMAEGLPLTPKGTVIRDAPHSTTAQYDCRAHAQRLNMMANEYAFNASQSIAMSGSCVCKREPCAAQAAPIISSNPTCPEGYDLMKYDHATPMNAALMSLYKNVPGKFIYVYDPHVQLPPLLSDGQLRHMIYPGCQSKNLNFYRCSKGAYDTSVKNGCSRTTDDCRKDDKWLD